MASSDVFTNFGYRGVVKVFCEGTEGRKEGVHLGAHRDETEDRGRGSQSNQFFKCVCQCCEGRPHAFACDGGCIFGGTAWERHAGNAGKKWENSIKVDSEKGPVTLKRWLNTTGVDKAREIGALKGRTIWVLWPDENAFYRGKVTGFTPDKGLHHVDYDDGDKEDLRLILESYYLAPEDSTTPEVSTPSNKDMGQPTASPPPKKASGSTPGATGMPELWAFPSPRRDGKTKSLRKLSQRPPKGRPANVATALLDSSSIAADGASALLPKPGAAPLLARPECMTPLQGHSSASKAGPLRGAGTPQDPIEFNDSDEEPRIDGAGAAAALAAAAEESAGHDDDDDTPLMHHARAWQAAAEASSQPAAVSTPETGAARKAEAEANIAAGMETASESEYGSVEGSLSQEMDPAPAHAKPSSASPDSSGPPQGQGFSQADHIQVALRVPGQATMAVPLIREGQVNWLSACQLHKSLLSNLTKYQFYWRVKQEEEIRMATPVERRFLASARIHMQRRRLGQARLLSVTAACNVLRKQDASAERIAAVQALAAAPALSAASLGKLPHMPVRSPAEEEEFDDSHADETDDTFADEDNEEDDYMGVEEDEDVDMVEEEDHPEAEYIHVLLKAPGVPPTPVSVVREKGTDWLSIAQFVNLLPITIGMKTLRRRAYKDNHTRLATPLEKRFLAEQGIFAGGMVPGRASVIPVDGACSILKNSGVSAGQIAAVRALQGAPALTLPQLSGLRATTASQSRFSSLSKKHARPPSAQQASAKKPTQVLPLPPPAGMPAVKAEASATAAPGQAGAGLGTVPKRVDGQKSKMDWSPHTSDTDQLEEHAGAAASPGEEVVSWSRLMLGTPEQPTQAKPGPSALTAGKVHAPGPGENAQGKKQSSPETPRAPGGRMKLTARKRTAAPDLAGQKAQVKAAIAEPRATIPARAAKRGAMEKASKGSSTQNSKAIAVAGSSRQGGEIVPRKVQVVHNLDIVTEQCNLVENIYTQEVYAEYKRRCDSVKGKPWGCARIPDYFLRGIVCQSADQTQRLRRRVVDQIATWLAKSFEQRRQHMAGMVEEVELTDELHPAYKRFKEAIGPLGLRDKERALRYCKDVPAGTLVGEYCGVLDRLDGVDTRDMEDPLGLDMLRRDKVTEVEYTSKEGQDAEGMDKALRAKWDFALELDPSKAHNQLCLINDYRNVPKAQGNNVYWLECEDSRTLEPHLFIFTVESVRAGQEVLLDYGERYHEVMAEPVRKAAELATKQPEIMAEIRGSWKALQAKEAECVAHVLDKKTLQAALEKEQGERARLEQKARSREEALRLKHERAAQAERHLKQAQQALQAERAMDVAQPSSTAGASSHALLKMDAQGSSAIHADLLGAPPAEERAIVPHGAAETPRAAANDGPGQARQGSPESDPPLQEQLTQTQEQLTYSQEQLAQREARIKSLVKELSTAQLALIAARAELAQQQQQAVVARQAQEAALQQERQRAQRMQQKFQSKEAEHLSKQRRTERQWNECADRSREEIKRLSQIAKDYERQLSEVSRRLPDGMNRVLRRTVQQLLEVARDDKLQIILPAEAGAQVPSALPEAPAQLPTQAPANLPEQPISANPLPFSAAQQEVPSQPAAQPFEQTVAQQIVQPEARSTQQVAPLGPTEVAGQSHALQAHPGPSGRDPRSIAKRRRPDPHEGSARVEQGSVEDPRSRQIKQRSWPEEAEERSCTRAREWRPHSPERQRGKEQGSMEDPRSRQIKQRSRPEQAEERSCKRAREWRPHSPERQHGSDPRCTAKAMGDAHHQRSAKRMRISFPQAQCRDPRRRSPEQRPGHGRRNASNERHSVDGRRSWPYDGPRDASKHRLSPELRQSAERGRTADLSPLRRVKEEPQAWDAEEQAPRATFPTDPRQAARNRAAHTPAAEARVDRQAYACNQVAPAEPPAEDANGRNEPFYQPGAPVPGWMQEMQAAYERPTGYSDAAFVPDGEANISRAGWASPGQDPSPASGELTNHGVAPAVDVPGSPAKRFCSFCKLYNHIDDECKWLLHPERKRPERCSRCQKIGHNARRCRGTR